MAFEQVIRCDVCLRVMTPTDVVLFMPGTFGVTYRVPQALANQYAQSEYTKTEGVSAVPLIGPTCNHVCSWDCWLRTAKDAVTEAFAKARPPGQPLDDRQEQEEDGMEEREVMIGRRRRLTERLGLS